MCELEVKLNASTTLMSSTRKNGETGETRENPKKMDFSELCLLQRPGFLCVIFPFHQTEELASLRITRKTQSYRKMLEEMCYIVFGFCSLEIHPNANNASITLHI